jgi:hypothetical protein
MDKKISMPLSIFLRVLKNWKKAVFSVNTTKGDYQLFLFSIKNFKILI